MQYLHSFIDERHINFISNVIRKFYTICNFIEFCKEIMLK